MRLWAGSIARRCARDARLLLPSLLLVGSACGARFSEGPRLARTHAQCEELDTFFPVPAQYDNLPVSHDLYRGCGKYVVVRCLTSSGATQCAVVEVTDVE